MKIIDLDGREIDLLIWHWHYCRLTTTATTG